MVLMPLPSTSDSTQAHGLLIHNLTPGLVHEAFPGPAVHALGPMQEKCSTYKTSRIADAPSLSFGGRCHKSHFLPHLLLLFFFFNQVKLVEHTGHVRA